MTSPCVSVCIPVYNSAALLEETVRSVQAQTFDDFEIVIVDDGSTDGTLVLAQELANDDSRIIVLRQDNSGSCVARNKAFTASRGRYLTTVDGDDLWPEYRLKEQLEILTANPGKIVIGATERFRVTSGGRVRGETTVPFEAYERSAYLRTLLQVPDQQKVSINTFMAPRQYILDNLWNPTFKTGHDWDVWLRLAKKHDFIHRERVYAYYRKHANSTTSKNSLRKVILCHTAVIESHGIEVMGSKREKNKVLITRMLRLANDSLYRGRISDAKLCLSIAAKAGAPFRSPWFYRLLAKTLSSSVGEAAAVRD